MTEHSANLRVAPEAPTQNHASRVLWWVKCFLRALHREDQSIYCSSDTISWWKWARKIARSRFDLPFPNASYSFLITPG